MHVFDVAYGSVVKHDVAFEVDSLVERLVGRALCLGSLAVCGQSVMRGMGLRTHDGS
jgi:hypothetical protein